MWISSVSSLWAQKLGNSPKEYEDAFWFSSTPQRIVAAVSDGATEASFAKEWAQILTRGFVEHLPRSWSRSRAAISQRHYFLEWLRPLQKEWHSGIDFTNLPWFAIDKAQKGAFASLLGLVIDLKKGFWQAMAIGDTNLFIVRDGRIVLSWPLDKHEQFGSCPFLVGSNPAKNDSVFKALRITGGRVRAGDMFLLATDAMADAIVQRTWRGFTLFNDQRTFLYSVGIKRCLKDLKNDDSTLVLVTIEEVE